MDQIEDFNNPLSHLDEVHRRALASSSRSYNCYCACGMITPFFLPTIDPEGATYATAMYVVHGIDLLKDSYCVKSLMNVIGTTLSKCCETRIDCGELWNYRSCAKRYVLKTWPFRQLRQSN